MRIIFMGTPEPARKVLQALIDAKNEIVCVVTQPDRPKGRGQKLTSSPVCELANQAGLPLEKPESVKDKVFISLLKSLSPDIIIVVAYGKILPKEILGIAKLGCINIHASLLPRYRGAAPVQWALLKGEKETGITIMQIDETLDTGNIWAQEKVVISKNDTTISLSKKLFEVGPQLLTKTLKQIKSGKLKSIPQNNAQASYAPKLRKEEGVLDFKKEAAAVRNRIRAFDPWPGAYTFFKEKILKIWKVNAKFIDLQKSFAAGEVIDIIKGRGFVVAALDKGLLIEEVQLEGKKRMSAYDFVLGHQLKVGENLPS
ncbi:MAG: methionyl-tRNA formyltransferase [Candidatus Margulisbacteria bacterium]|nr:methionyl-tRNA formyltransferase [Candidatus Margulisiibacteriota bacterium]MBU1021773.1 methionyl-tRNA formyltransferase [Candidatus Margulisiibacteriota bacterium]MBU1729519.1 methionyl-tRNA formyltransferase [Candidatus Margulisiibacteriota bacterium]MBU1955380.1 methionyl-tRNA formyltransferase [Candidatus Margulisiibacteriota bacterium]